MVAEKKIPKYRFCLYFLIRSVGLQRKQISPSFSTIPTSSAPPNIDNVNVAEISPLLPSQSLVPTFVPLDLAPLQIVRCFPTGTIQCLIE